MSEKVYKIIPRECMATFRSERCQLNEDIEGWTFRLENLDITFLLVLQLSHKESPVWGYTWGLRVICWVCRRYVAFAKLVSCQWKLFCRQEAVFWSWQMRFLPLACGVEISDSVGESVVNLVDNMLALQKVWLSWTVMKTTSVVVRREAIDMAQFGSCVRATHSHRQTGIPSLTHNAYV